jgi:ornithine cyclodeaminase
VPEPAGGEPLLLGASDVERALTLDVAFASQREAFLSLARGEAVAPDKLTLPGAPGTAWTLCYAARTAPEGGVVVKVVAVAEHNPARGLPMVTGVVLATDAATGRLAAIMDGTSITTLRTAAASAVAVAALATDDAAELAVIGSGVQAVAHVHAIARVRPLRRVRLWSPNPRHRHETASRLNAALEAAVVAVGSAAEAVKGAAIVATCTHSATPVVAGDWIEPGCCVVSVGSYDRDRAEVDDRLLQRAGVIAVDDPAYALRYGGPIIGGIERGVITRDDLVALGDILAGSARGRRAPTDITFFNSVGIGAQDAAAAWAVVRRARELGLGRPIAW